MNPKPWTLLDTQLSKPSSAVPPSSSLLAQSWFSFKPHHLNDASLLSLPPSALPSRGGIWVGFCFWVCLVLVAEMVAFHNLLPPANLTTSPGTEPSTGSELKGHLMLEEVGARVNLRPLESEPPPHLPWTMNLCISTCLVGLLRSPANLSSSRSDGPIRESLYWGIYLNLLHQVKLLPWTGSPRWAFVLGICSASVSVVSRI